MNTPQDPDEWQQWRDDYLRTNAHVPAASTVAETPTPEALAAQVARDTRKLWRALAGEIAGALFVVVFWAVTLARSPLPALVPMASVSIAGVVGWVAWLVYTYRGQWRPTGDSVRAHLAATLARRQAEARWFAFAQAWTALMGLAVAAWAPIIVRARWAMYSAEPWRAVVGFGVAFAILVGCLVYYGRRRTRALREARAWAALWDASPE